MGQTLTGFVEARTSLLDAVHHAVILARGLLACDVKAPGALVPLGQFRSGALNFAEVHPLGPLPQILVARNRSEERRVGKKSMALSVVRVLNQLLRVVSYVVF